MALNLAQAKSAYLRRQSQRVAPLRRRGLGQVTATVNAIQNYQSGATGSDTLLGAEAGASIGSVVPIIGTAVGAIIGAAVGAVSSLFGGGKADPETMAFQNYVPKFNANPAIAAELTPAQNFQLLAGVFDAKCNSPGHSTPLEQHWGRMEEGAFLNDLLNEINAAISAGTVASDANAVTLYTDVVEPYLESITGHFGGGNTCANIKCSWTDVCGNHFGNALIAAIIYLIYQWQVGKISCTTPLGICGQIDTHVPPYIGNYGQTTSPSGTIIASGSGDMLVTPEGNWVAEASGDWSLNGNTGGLIGPPAAPDGTLYLLYLDGQVIAINQNGAVYSVTGVNTWTQLPLSPEGTSITPTSGDILVTAQGVWGFGQGYGCGSNYDLLLNGAWTGTGDAAQLEILNGLVTSVSAQGYAYAWNGSAWQPVAPAVGTTPAVGTSAATTSATSAPSTCTASASLSPDNTSITAGSGGSLTIASGVITFGLTQCDGNSEVLLNGSSMGNGYGTEVAIVDGVPVLYQADGSIWNWTGSAWSELSAAPSVVTCTPDTSTATVSAPATTTPATTVSSGISTTTLLILGALALGAVYLLRQHK